MRHKTLIFTIFALVFALAASACAQTPVATVVSEVPAATAAKDEPAAASDDTWEPIPCNVVFDSDRDGNREVYIMGPDGENLTNLTNDPADDWDPAISPDGTRIAFVSNRDNENGGGQFIYTMNADGSDVRQLTFEENCDNPDWSHDGSMITYASNGDIYFADAYDGKKNNKLTDTPDVEDKSPAWSPDGSKIAWLSGNDGVFNAMVSSPDEDDMHAVTDTGTINKVQWTTDGRVFVDSWGWKDKDEFCHNCVVTQDGNDIEDAGGKGEVQRFIPFWNGKGDRVELIEGSLDNGPTEIYLVGEVFPDIFYNMTNNAAWDRNPDWPAKCGPEYVPSEQDLSNKANEQSAQPQATGPKDPKDIVIGYEASRPIRSWPT
jgi:dipeptidyl aminopeptidase/acylaminoacyl peptidase